MGEMIEKMGEALDYQVINAQNHIRRGRERAKEALTSETGAVDIVVILLLVVVAIVLVVVFRDQLSGFIETVFGKLNTAVTNAPADMNTTATQ